MPVAFGKSINGVKQQIVAFEHNIPFQLERLTVDISYWRELNERIDSTVVYLHSKQGVMEAGNATTCKEIRAQLNILEVNCFAKNAISHLSVYMQ